MSSEVSSHQLHAPLQPRKIPDPFVEDDAESDSEENEAMFYTPDDEFDAFLSKCFAFNAAQNAYAPISLTRNDVSILIVRKSSKASLPNSPKKGGSRPVSMRSLMESDLDLYNCIEVKRFSSKRSFREAFNHLSLIRPESMRQQATEETKSSENNQSGLTDKDASTHEMQLSTIQSVEHCDTEPEESAALEEVALEPEHSPLQVSSFDLHDEAEETTDVPSIQVALSPKQVTTTAASSTPSATTAGKKKLVTGSPALNNASVKRASLARSNYSVAAVAASFNNKSAFKTETTSASSSSAPSNESNKRASTKKTAPEAPTKVPLTRGASTSAKSSAVTKPALAPPAPARPFPMTRAATVNTGNNGNTASTINRSISRSMSRSVDPVHEDDDNCSVGSLSSQTSQTKPKMGSSMAVAQMARTALAAKQQQKAQQLQQMQGKVSLSSTSCDTVKMPYTTSASRAKSPASIKRTPSATAPTTSVAPANRRSVSRGATSSNVSSTPASATGSRKSLSRANSSNAVTASSSEKAGSAKISGNGAIGEFVTF